MKAHKLDMIAAWAKDNGIKGYEHLDPVNREKARQRGIKAYNEEQRRKEQERWEKYAK